MDSHRSGRAGSPFFETSWPGWRCVFCRLLVLCLIAHVGCRRQPEPAAESAEAPPASAARRATDLDAAPLAARAEIASETLFVRVDAEQSGIDFVNRGAEPDRNSRGEPINFRSDSAQHTSGGVCIGDYDADGLPDIFLTRPEGGNRLYRNLGDFRFADVTQSARIIADDTWGMGASFVDVDNDGDLDLYVCCYDQANLLFVNQGDGTFVERAWRFGLDFRGSSVMMDFMDYDRDGDLDSFLLTNALGRLTPPQGRVRVRHNVVEGWAEVPESQREAVGALVKPDGSVHVYATGQYDHLFENRGPDSAGDFRFEDVGQQAGIEGTDIGLATVWYDFDRDGWPDLYVANDFFGPDRLYHNNADGTFTNVLPDAVPYTPWYSMGADAGDVNNDGWFDLLATDMAGATHYKRHVGQGDLEEDAWFLNYPKPPQYIRNALFLNTGGQPFMELAHLAGLAASDWTWSVKFADLDGDGWLDVFITNGMTRDLFNSDLKREEKLVVSREKAARFWQTKPIRRDRNLAFRNERDLRFSNVAAEWGLDHLGVSFGAALGDLDGDGDLDLVVNNYQEPVHLYRNQSSGDHRIKLRLQGTVSNRWGIGAVVELATQQGAQTRQLNLAGGYMAADEPFLHFGLGDESVISKLTVRWPSGHVQNFADLPADRFYTITEPPGAPATRKPAPPPPPMFTPSKALPKVAHRETPFRDFDRQPLLPFGLSQLGPGMAWGDADGDGDDDLYLAGARGHAGQLLLRESEGTFRAAPQPVFEEDRNAEDMAPLFFDADADGDQDLYVVSGSVESPAADRLYLNDGTGQFNRAAADQLPTESPVTDATISSLGAVAAADYDRDGDLDLFVGGRCVVGEYPLPPESRLLRNDGGRFVSVAADFAPELSHRGMVTSALWSDVNNDGWLDLLITYDWGPVRLFANQSGRRLVDVTERVGLADRTGWWNGIAGHDLNHDGHIDYVVTNFGLNSIYQATADRPVRIYYGQFDDSGRPHIVEAAVTDDGLLPIRNKTSVENALPVIGRRFPTFDSYAKATLAEIYTQERLDHAQMFEANTLETGVLLNDGRGHFQFRPLPRVAQAAPAFGVAVEDFDADGNPDIYLVQNLFNTQPELGHMAGGVSMLLAGDGQGNFTPVWPNKSGLVVPGDAKSLTVTDLNADHHPDVVIGVNNGPLLAFENQSQSGRPLAVRLVGRPGNPTAVGARVTVHLTDGTTQTAELTAGGGYLSQSDNQLFFGLGDAKVDHINVRWPDGTITEHAAPDSNHIEIKR